MDARTLEALKASIAKWERNAVAEKPDHYLTADTDCPLCQMFTDDKCAGCPVRERTGHSFCSCTPYSNAAVAAFDWAAGRGPAETAHAAARDEVAFLKSLLPAEDA